MWLSGDAGTGKTAILGTISDACQTHGDLAASFFFSSASGNRDLQTKRCFVATLAYQLCQHKGLQDVGAHILQSISDDPAVFDMRLRDQVERLILQPLRNNLSTMSDWPKKKSDHRGRT